MYHLIACILLTGAFFLRRWLLTKQVVPVLAAQSFQQTNYEAIVPLAEVGELSIELETDFDKEWELYKPVLIEEADTILLLEAERLVSEVESIAASKVDVYGKLQQLIPGFLMLHKTEYYEPINKLIFLTVQSECHIELSEQQLAALWK